MLNLIKYLIKIFSICKIIICRLCDYFPPPGVWPPLPYKMSHSCLGRSAGRCHAGLYKRFNIPFLLSTSQLSAFINQARYPASHTVQSMWWVDCRTLLMEFSFQNTNPNICRAGLAQCLSLGDLRTDIGRKPLQVSVFPPRKCPVRSVNRRLNGRLNNDKKNK